MNIGFIGLGNMGSGMAANLSIWCRENSHRLLVWDINQQAIDNLVAAGAEDAGSIARLAQHVEVLFTSLPSSREVGLVARGDQGLLANLPEGAIWFETSTNDLSEWKTLQAEAPEHLQLVDAPVTGGAEGAAAGTLTMLLGIEQQLLNSCSELLASFTGKAVRMGPCGAGYVTKLCQLHLNYLVAQGIGEALMLGAKADLHMPTLYKVLQNSCAQSYVVDAYIPKVLDGSYDPSFALGLATKDMRLITALGEHLEVELRLADGVYETYKQATEAYGPDAPHLSVVRLIEESAGKLLRNG